MQWLVSLASTPSAAQSVFVLCVVAALGLAIGRIRIFGVGIGIAGVLFSGLIFGHFGIHLEEEVLHFAREGGLILFVYTIGLQLGPSFVSSMRQHGVKLNALAAFIVLSGVAILVGIHFLAGLPMAAGVGVYTGAVTNTPALGAAQEVLRGIAGVSPATASLPGVAYAMAYPLGVVGIIGSIVATRFIFGIDVKREEQEFADVEKGAHVPIHTANLVVQNPNIEGLAIQDIPGYEHSGVTVSRILKGDRLSVATPSTRLSVGDTVLAVGVPESLEKLRVVIGSTSNEDLRAIPSPVTSERILVTRRDVIGKSLRELQLNEWYGVTVTRLQRNEVELVPNQSLTLQIGDLLTVVGEAENLERTSTALGNSAKALQHLEIAPIFVGILLGVVLGSIPVALPGLPAAVKLGLAGGPLIVGMLLGRIGRIGPLVWYMPPNANLMLREAGIVLFLACVGLKAGDRFVQTLLAGPGLLWMGYGLAVTILPMLAAGAIGRIVFKLNYLTLAGAMSGSMTDPPALAFANSLSESNAASLAYAAVYPLTMILRVVSAQLLILLFGAG